MGKKSKNNEREKYLLRSKFCGSYDYVISTKKNDRKFLIKYSNDSSYTKNCRGKEFCSLEDTGDVVVLKFKDGNHNKIELNYHNFVGLFELMKPFAKEHFGPGYDSIKLFDADTKISNENTVLTNCDSAVSGNIRLQYGDTLTR